MWGQPGRPFMGREGIASQQKRGDLKKVNFSLRVEKKNIGKEKAQNKYDETEDRSCMLKDCSTNYSKADAAVQ